jgi:cytoskeletal protein RodZ
LSSILDALKKAEQKSAGEDGRGTPWPAYVPEKSADRKKWRRWIVPIGAALALCVLVMVAWKTWFVITSQTADVGKDTLPPTQTTGEKDAPEAKRQAPEQTVTVNQQTLRAIVEEADVTPSRIEKTHTNPADQVKTSVANAPVTDREPVAQASGALETHLPAPSEAILPEASPAAEPTDIMPAPQDRPAMEATEPLPPVDKTQEPEKNFRDDPRIDLQALVWAPVAADRFVVINNSLVKEGGSVGSFTVVEINPEDVLLSEGSDRWNQKFTIR